MRHALVFVLAILVVSTLTVPPASSAPVRVRLHQPRLVDADTAVLKGVVRGRDAVRIQRSTASKRRWVSVKRVRANRRGVFRTRVRATPQPVRYRATAAGVRSAVRVVRGEPSPTFPETPDDASVIPLPPKLPLDPVDIDLDVPLVPPIDLDVDLDLGVPLVPDVEVDVSVNPPPAPAPPPSDACGPRPAKSDGGYWSCTLADDFDGTRLDREVWRPQPGFKQGTPSGMPCYIDDPSVISVRDGALRLRVREVPEPLDCPGLNVPATAHVAGMVSTYRLFSQKYGRFEARIKNTATGVQGLHEAFWLWPDDRYTNVTLWPVSGEIDIAETYSLHPNLAIPFLHSKYDALGPVPTFNTAWHCAAPRGEFNTYTLEWSANRLKILVNGTTCLVHTSGDPAFQKPYIIALTQGLGATGNEYDGRAPLPATMTIDYVRVWK